MRRPCYLLSIKPVFGEQILSGVKGYELRRRGRFEPGSIMVLYESSPVRAVVGEFKAGRVFRVELDELLGMLRRGELRGCGEADVPYVLGARRVVVIEVVEPLRYPRPVTLAELRRLVPGFRPPVSYARFDEYYEAVRRAAFEVLRNESLKGAGFVY
ncbi:MAG: DNA-binding protein [Thermoprotei archaeon]|nr:MAG: DNA-binding protein [Thermoprotei archaeon]